MSSRTDTSSQVAAVAEELLDLMDVTKADLRDAALFPAITEAPSVTSEATRRNVVLNNTDDIRHVLRSILMEKREIENAIKSAHLNANLAHMADRPLAQPALEMLGLTQTTENKGIGDRREIAAPSRGVAVSTMRKHQKIIAREVAVILVTDGVVTGTDVVPPHHRVGLEPILVRVTQDPDLLQTLTSLSKRELRQLAVETTTAYDAFYDALVELHHAIEFSFEATEDGFQLVDEFDPFISLHLLAQVGLSDLLLYLPNLMVKAEAPSSYNRFCWLARLLRTFAGTLPQYARREKDLLRYACEQSNDNLHLFLAVLESSHVGTRILDGWLTRLQLNSNEKTLGLPAKAGLGDAHVAWMGTFRGARCLAKPTPISMQWQFGLAAHVWAWGREPDVSWVEEITREGAKVKWAFVEDRAEDTEFLISLTR